MNINKVKETDLKVLLKPNKSRFYTITYISYLYLFYYIFLRYTRGGKYSAKKYKKNDKTTKKKYEKYF